MLNLILIPFTSQQRPASFGETVVFKSYNYVKFNSHLFYQPAKGQRPLAKHVLRRLVPLKEGGSGVAILRKWS